MKYTNKFLVFLIAAFSLNAFSQTGDRLKTPVKVGNGSVSEKKMIFDIGSGSANPVIRSTAGGTLQFSNNGVDFSSFGSGSSLGLNYVTNADFELNTNGWNTYSDAASATPVNGTGGTAVGISITRNTTTPLRGTGDLKISHAASNSQGEGVSVDFTIQPQDKNKNLAIQFDMNSSAANYAAGDLRVFVFDVTNNVVITPISGNQLPKGTQVYNTAFLSTSSTSYRLIFHQATTSTLAYDVYVDNVLVNNGGLPQGPAVTSWKQYNPTFNGITATGASTNVFWRQVGDTVQLRGNVKLATTSAGGMEMSLPNGWAIDTSKLNFVPNSSHFGYYQRLDSSNLNPITTGGAMGEIFYNTGAAPGYLSFGPITSGTGNEYLPVASNSVFSVGEDVVFDNITVPVSQISGSGTLNAFTQDNLYDWHTYTPIWTGQSGSPAIGNGTLTGKWRRVGDEMEINIATVWGGSTVDGSGTYCWSLPDDYLIDYSKVSHLSSYRGNFGTLHSLQSSNQATWVIGKCDYAGDHYVSAVTGNGTPATIQGSTFDYVSLNFKVPVVQFTNNHNALVGFTEATQTTAGLVNPSNTNGVIYSGRYTPTITAVTNTGLVSVPGQWFYTRVGKIVSVSGLVDITNSVSAAGSTVGISLPVASVFVDGFDANGLAITYSDPVNVNGHISADATNNRAQMDFLAPNTVAKSWRVQFTYEIK